MKPVRSFLFLITIIISTGSIRAQFGPSQPLPLDHPVGSLSLVDMDGDGHPDLVGLFNWNEFKWARNTNGTGAFDAPSEIATTYSAPLFHAIVDLQLDGLPDIVYVKQDLSVRAIRNLGNGTFEPPQSIGQLFEEPGAMGCMDITGDGFPEVIFSLPVGTSGSGYGWYPNTGNGFLPLVQVEDAVDGPASAVLLVGDMDGIGGNDLVLQNSDGAIIVQRNMNADATNWQMAVAVAFPSFPYVSPHLLDVDGDGDLDLGGSNGSISHWAENRVGEGGSWLPFTDHTIGSTDASGAGLFANLGCGPGASFLYTPIDDELPMRWKTYLPVIGDMSFDGDLSDLERGAVILIGDLDGDGRNDLIMERPEGLAWHRNMTSDPTTVLEMPVLDTLCVFGPPLPLPAMAPSGGRWSGDWVIDDVLHRANVGIAGNYPIAHTVYEPLGCPVAGVSPIQLLNGPIVSPDMSAPICTGSGPIELSTQPTDVTWSGIGQDGILDPETFTGGAFACSWTDNTGMECASVIGPVLIWSTVPVAIAPAGPFCITDAMQVLTASIVPPQGGTWSGDIAGTVGNVAQFDPSMGAGTYQVSLHVDPSGPQQCANDATITVVVSDEIPIVTIDPIEAHCANGSAITLSGGQPIGGTWSGNAIQGGVMEPVLLGVGAHTVNYTYQDPGGCSATAQTTVELVDLVQITWDADDLTLCSGDPAVLFSATPVGGTWGSPIGEDGILDPAELTEGNYPITYSWVGPNGCSLTDEGASVIVPPTTEVEIASVATLCDDGAPVELTANVSGTWSGSVSGEGASVWFDPTAIGAGTWTVQLEATEVGACPGLSAIDVLVEVCTGMDDLVPQASLLLAPNPFDGITQVFLRMEGLIYIEVLDASGRLLLARNASGPTILDLDLSDQPNGAFVVRVRNQDHAFHLRAVKSE